MIDVEIKLDTRAFERDLRRFRDVTMRQVLARPLNRTAFEILEAERKEATSIFTQESPRGREFLSGKGSFRFDAAKPDNLVATIMPGRSRDDRRTKILSEHRAGGTIEASKRRLEVGGEIAIPIGEAGEARRRSGRVPQRIAPAKLLGAGGRGFVLGRALAVRRGHGRSSRIVRLFALAKTITLAPTFDFYRAAAETARRVFPEKVRSELARLGRTK